MQINKKGFTMIELLVVLLIIGVLAAVAAPLYFANTSRAKASEAVATMSLLRQSMRDYYASHTSYPADISDITLPPPTGAGVDVGIAQYFSNECYTIDTAGSFNATPAPSPVAQNFVIRVDGGDTVTPPVGDPLKGAMKGDEVNGETSGDPPTTSGQYRLEMDNTGRIFVSYDGGTHWGEW